MNMKLTGVTLALTALLALPAQAGPDGLESQVSAKDHAQTVVALRKALNASEAKIFQEIDHRSNAIDTEVKLPPSHVFIFGNPDVGSRLMACVPLAAVDLPMRMLVKSDGDDNTKLYWTSASALLARYSSGLSGECQKLAAQVDDRLARLARKAAVADE